MKWIGVLAGIVMLQVAVADSAHVDFDLGLIFPQQLGGMPCEKLEIYNTEELGYSMFYGKGVELSAEVSVFNFGRSEIGDGPRADGVEMVFGGVEDEMKKAVENGQFEKFRKRGSLKVPAKSPLQFERRIFQYSEFREVDGELKSVPRMNSVYVTGSHNHFIKVLFRFDAAQGQEAMSMADELVKQLVRMLVIKKSNEELILAACDAVLYDPAGLSGMAAAQRVFAHTQEMGRLNVYDSLFVWPQDSSKPENADLLLAAYFAGMIKVVISQDLETGGEFEAFEAMMAAYETMHSRGQIVAIPKLDEWAKSPDKKSLYQKLLVEFGYKAP
jgi:hypothetical protein